MKHERNGGQALFYLIFINYNNKSIVREAQPLLASVVVIHLVSLFTLSAVTKLISIKLFVQSVQQFQLLPKRLAILFGGCIPLIELIGASLLLYHHSRLYGILVIIVLLTLFSYAVRSVLRTGKQISCSCYGRLLEAEVDRFTGGKIIYLFILVGFVAVMHSYVLLEITVPAVITGTGLTILFLFSQKMWFIYKENMARLGK